MRTTASLRRRRSRTRTSPREEPRERSCPRSVPTRRCALSDTSTPSPTFSFPDSRPELRDRSWTLPAARRRSSSSDPTRELRTTWTGPPTTSDLEVRAGGSLRRPERARPPSEVSLTTSQSSLLHFSTIQTQTDIILSRLQVRYDLALCATVHRRHVRQAQLEGVERDQGPDRRTGRRPRIQRDPALQRPNDRHHRRIGSHPRPRGTQPTRAHPTGQGPKDDRQLQRRPPRTGRIQGPH